MQENQDYMRLFLNLNLGLVSSGRPPGLYPGGGYEQKTLVLGEGDALFLFTDGVVEAEDESEEPFGMDRLEAVLGVHRGDDLAALIARVHEAVRAHRGPREADDDATMLALRILARDTAGLPE